LLVLLGLVKHLEAVVLWIASMRAARWLAEYDWKRKAHGGAGPGTPSQEGDLGRSEALRNALRERHGWRWRYRDRWVVVAGDEPIVKRLVPGLVQNGYTISGDTVLLYARQTSNTRDTDWLEQVLRFRRRRPADAIVAVVRAQTTGKQRFDGETIAQCLVQHVRAMRWSAPAYLLNVTESGSGATSPEEAIGCMWSGTRPGVDAIDDSLHNLSGELADAGVVRLAKVRSDSYPAELSHHIAQYGRALSDLVAQIGQSRIWRSSIHGVFFTPLLKERDAVGTQEPAEDGETIAQRTVWQTVADHSRRLHGRRVGFSFSTVAACLVTGLAALWIVGTVLSGLSNSTTILSAADTASKLTTPRDRTQAALNLDALQKQLDTLEVRQREGAPWYARFGLNRDAELLASLWTAYAAASNRILIQPVRAKLEADLRQLGALTDQELASSDDQQVKRAYRTLKAYLMLAQPQHADSTFLIPELLGTAEPARPESSSVSAGGWRDLTQRLATFHANHLAQHGAALAIAPDATLVGAARQTLVSVVGLQNSTDKVYEQIIEENRSKYPPVSLQALLGDVPSRGLFTTNDTLPGIYTRAAWDERIGRAIDDANEQRTVTGDWVLSEASATSAPTSAAALKQGLRERYFADYARHWQQFLNSVHWQSDTSLSGTVDQLSLYADAQRSPLSALFKVIVYQAGAGGSGQSLSDTLVTKARELIKGAETNPSRASPPPDAPLAGAFGPLLRLAGSELAGNAQTRSTTTAQPAGPTDLSLPRYLERVTAVRLKLQQIMTSPDPDAMSRTAAQAILQGKTSELGDSRDYAARVAASVGEQWAGFGDALFQRPLDQTWDVVLKPASASLNEAWRSAVVAAWNKSFGGRYPFADSDNDASLPEMARFLRTNDGVIAQFVTTQLAGILERQGDQWVVAQGAGRNALAVDPEFMRALNRLARVSNVLFPNGDAGVRYELRAIPTPGVTDLKFKLAGRELHYFNQKEEWTPFIWPGEALENGAHVEWQTDSAGVRSDLDFTGRFGLIRLFERATVTQQDGARYVLKWTPGAQTSGAVAHARPETSAPVKAAVPATLLKPHIRDDWTADPQTTFASGVEAQPASSVLKTPKDDPPPRALQKPLAVQVQLRSESGAGPLDALMLRHFVLPSRIFLSSATGKRPANQASNPPPLPAAALEAAKHAATPLPRTANTLHEIE
jgi:type VI secretion system protein ImpL